MLRSMTALRSVKKDDDKMVDNIKKHKRLKFGIVAVLLLCGVCWGYAADYYHADDIAAAMSSAADVTVEQKGNTLAFIPERAETGLIFYPGGKVEYTAYAPLMRALADNGVLGVLVRMPLNLAVLDMNAANGIPEQYPQISTGILEDIPWAAAWRRATQRETPPPMKGLFCWRRIPPRISARPISR